MSASAKRVVLFVVYPGVQLVDLTGPFDILGTVNALAARRGNAPVYELLLASVDGKPVRASVGFEIHPDVSLVSLRRPLDTMIVPGTFEIDSTLRIPKLVSSVRRLAKRTRRLVSVCTGTFILAEAGLLDDRTVTTHWAGCTRLAKSYPRLDVQLDPIFVRSGDLYTSAGVTSGMDLALALVEEDVGRKEAIEIARWFVMYLRRPGGQSQFSVHLSAQLADREPIQEIVTWIADHPAADLSVESLARRAGMSPRNFARTFLKEAGVTPARHVTAIRLDAARRRLEDSDAPLQSIAEECGFGTVESLRRTFQSRLKLTPGAYRARFR